MISLRTPLALGAVLLAAASPLSAKTLPCDLDPLLAIPANWQMTPDDFEKTYTSGNNKHFMWLTADRTRAKLSRKLYGNVEIDLSAFGGEVPVQEVIADFADGKLNLVSLSIYNRADSGEIVQEDFSARFTAAGKGMGKLLGISPRKREADSKNGLLTEGFSWYSKGKGVALLEHNEKAMGGAAREFLRLRVSRPEASGSLAASMLHSRGGAAARLGDLPGNLSRNDAGDVYISNLPMVDQGDKGYCVVASTQRVFEYYGIGADMHQIAQIAESDPNKGTSTLTMAEELGKIDYRFKTRLEIIGMTSTEQVFSEVFEKKGSLYCGKPVDERKTLKEIRSYIDKGLPLLWSLELGRYPEIPQLTPQAGGGHMRMIIGYNDKTEEILFSDSWGAGHELKRMKMGHAYQATRGLFVLKPTVH
jgi:hypothetical protein